MSSTLEQWREANQSYLLAALAGVRAGLERRSPGNQEEAPEPDEIGRRLEEIAAGMPSAPALEVLCERFGLSPFEREVLLLCAGVELESGFAERCAAAQGDPARRYPTFSLALAALPEPHWSAIAPSGPLRYWRLLEVGAGPALTSSPLRIDERVLHFLTGLEPYDERLAGIVRPVGSFGDEPEPVPSHRTLAERIASTLSVPDGRGGLPAVQLCGSDPSAKRSIAAAVCGALGLRLQTLSAADLPGATAELTELIRLWEREAALSGSALLVDAEEADGHDGHDGHRENALSRLIEEVRGVLFLSVRERRPARQRRVLAFDVPRPGREEQGALWRAALGSAVEDLDGQLDAVLSQFQLGVGSILSAGSQVEREREVSQTFNLWDACRAQSRPRLEGLAQRIESVADWDDLVLPEAQKKILRSIAVQVRRRQVVYRPMGLRRPQRARSGRRRRSSPAPAAPARPWPPRSSPASCGSISTGSTSRPW